MPSAAPSRRSTLSQGWPSSPHFDTFGHRWVDSVLEAPPAEDVVIVGVDTRSAALWDGRTWIARGPGRISVITQRDRRVYEPGTLVQSDWRLGS